MTKIVDLCATTASVLRTNPPFRRASHVQERPVYLPLMVFISFHHGVIRDLMSPVISEQHYKNGMKKDDNGFMDIDWCCSKVLNNWDELRSVFMQANAKKAIAPTQVGWFPLPPRYCFYRSFFCCHHLSRTKRPPSVSCCQPEE